MSALLADIDATCASLGYNDGNVYHPDPDAIQGLKVRASERDHTHVVYKLVVPLPDPLSI